MTLQKGWAAALVVGHATVTPAALWAQQTLYAEVTSGVTAKVELAGGRGFAEDVVYELYFPSEESSLPTEVPDPNGEPGIDFIELAVARIVSQNESVSASVIKCRLDESVERCRELSRPAVFSLLADGSALQILIPSQAINWGRDFFRLRIGTGRLGLNMQGGDSAAVASPAIDGAVLPTLTQLEQKYLVMRPFLRADFTPLIADVAADSGGLGDLLKNVGLSFEGGLYRPLVGGSALWRVEWNGDIASKERLAFDQLALDGGASFNLLPGDWLPLTVSGRGEADRVFEAIDLAGTVKLAYVPAFNVDFQTGPYRPALAPKLEVVLGYGKAVKRDSASAENAFFRAGYELRWRIPVGSYSTVRLHQAGLWNDPVAEAGAWHALWDVMVEFKIGDLTYFIEYQEGEAAPLFVPTETTRVGLSVKAGKVQPQL